MPAGAEALEDRLDGGVRHTAEAWLAAIVEGSDDAIIGKSLEGIIQSWNRGAEKLYGYRADEIVGRSIATLVPPGQRDEVRHILERIRAGEVVEHLETTRVRKDGERVEVSVTISPVRDATGGIIGASAIARDVTEQRQQELVRARLAAIVESSDDAIIGKGLDGIIESWNRGAEKLYGYRADEVLGKPIYILVPPGQEDEVPWILDRIRAGETVDHFETVRVRKDGELVEVSLTISPVRDRRGRVAGASTIARDVTDRRRLERELTLAHERALEASRLKSEFLANMSHEIRTPMNGVIGMTGLLLATDLSDEQREYAETVRHSAEALLTVINDILDFSKIEAGHLELEIVEFDVRTAVEEVADLLAEQAHSKGLELAVLFAPDVPGSVAGDPGRLRQVLTNLLGNAIKFTDAGEVVISVRTEAETDDAWVIRFEVSDTGVGIPREKQAALFQSFSQVDASATRRRGGTGLGLAIARQLTELMGGEIGLESEPTVGSRFWFTARLLKVEEPAIPAPAHWPSLDGLRVLAVDDNPTNRQVLVQSLHGWGSRAATARDGQDALAMLRDAAAGGEPFQIAVLDYQMPGMDGGQLARAIRDDPAIAKTRLAMLTSSTTRSDPRITGVFDAALTKPARQSVLYDCLALLMGREPRRPTQPLVTQDLVAAARGRQRAHVLVVEDNVVNQKVTARMLEKLGHRVDVAADGREAVEAVRRIAYAAILMDCQMPEMDGYEATRAIRSLHPRAARTPIIAMTAGAMQRDEEKALAAGMDAYVSKPVKLEDLAAVLEGCLSRGEVDGDGSTPDVTRGERPLDARLEAHDRTAEGDGVSEAVLDATMVAGLRALDDEDDSLRELVDAFFEDTHERLAKLRTALADDDRHVVSAVGHALRGSCGTYGAAGMAELCGALESLAESGDLSGAAEVLDRLEAEFGRIRVALPATLGLAPQPIRA